MRSSSIKGLAALSLAIWLISGTAGQVLCLHAELEHHRHDHHDHHGGTVGLTHCHPDTHEHQIPAEISLPAIPGFRGQSSPAALSGVGMPSWHQGEAISQSTVPRLAALRTPLPATRTVVLLI